jgi:translation elongation factor EF-Tu-like GTPase
MPGLREALNRLNGKTVPRAAVLYTQSDRLNDPELIQLVQLEVNELLQRYGVQGLDVIKLPGDQIDLKVKGLLALPARNVRFTSPQ